MNDLNQNHFLRLGVSFVFGLLLGPFYHDFNNYLYWLVPSIFLSLVLEPFNPKFFILNILFGFAGFMISRSIWSDDPFDNKIREKAKRHVHPYLNPFL